jgi:hypothetical protein
MQIIIHHNTFGTQKLCRLLDGDTAGMREDHWVINYRSLKTYFRKYGWEVYGSSESNYGDVLVVVDLPDSRRDLQKILSMKRVKFKVLIIEESPGVLQAQNFENFSDFDLVLTYNSEHLSFLKAKFFPISTGLETINHNLVNIPFSDRKMLCLIASNRSDCPLAHLRTNLFRFLFLGPLFSGYRLPPNYLKQVMGFDSRHTTRAKRQLVNKMSGFSGMHAYGYGWAGERLSWLNRIIPNNSFSSARPIENLSKIAVISEYRFGAAYENFILKGYVTEKFFDVLLAGAVPVYLGGELDPDLIPHETYVNASEFASAGDLMSMLSSMSELSWLRMYQSGRDLLRSAKLQEVYGPNAWLERLKNEVTLLHSQRSVNMNDGPRTERA